jgi:tRNA pseudouridine38-40 synthase
MRTRSDYCCRLLLAYDGTNYAGWQIQPGRDTIQGLLRAAVVKLFDETISIHGAGRTDSGVHACGQVASFTAKIRIPPTTLVRALNANLPEDIRVLKAALVAPDFHARFSARRKEYRYQIVNAVVMDPFLRTHALHHPRKLDLAAMRRLARLLVGRHDFAALSSKPHREVKTTVRTISRLSVQRDGNLITVAVEADGFLYKMVRTIVGALLKVGRGEAAPEEMGAYLLGRKRTHFVTTAPPHGLILWNVWY